MNLNSICSSCRHEDNCTFIDHSPNAILMCEEFELEIVEKKINKKTSEEPKALNGSALSHVKSEFTGLCVNCEDRADCKSCKSDFVVWHCEEYAVA